MSFVNSEQLNNPCKGINIHIQNSKEHFFVDETEIRHIVQQEGNVVKNQAIGLIDVPRLERSLKNHPAISGAEVYIDVNGALTVNVKQREPLLRIINNKGESYYIDIEGKLMPLSSKYTAHVLLVNGNINATYAKWYPHSIKKINSDEALKSQTKLEELYLLAEYISNDPFWKAQIQQVYVDEKNEIELIPRVGDHIIKLGEIVDVDKKFKKLMIFYKEGLAKTGWWNNYSEINLKYEKQIICTKK